MFLASSAKPIDDNLNNCVTEILHQFQQPPQNEF